MTRDRSQANKFSTDLVFAVFAVLSLGSFIFVTFLIIGLVHYRGLIIFSSV